MEKYAIVKKGPLKVVGITCRTSNAPDEGSVDIPRHWEMFFRENVLDRIPNKLSDEVIALYCDYESDYTKPYTLLIGCAVDPLADIPQGMTSKSLPSSTYAVFHAIGEHPKTLINTWEMIWQTELDRTYTGDFELYGAHFTNSPPEVEVYIVINPSAD